MLSGLQQREIWIVWNVECQIAIAALGIGIWNIWTQIEDWEWNWRNPENSMWNVQMISGSNDETEAELVNSTS